jgi:hypothetical protein
MSFTVSDVIVNAAMVWNYQGIGYFARYGGPATISIENAAIIRWINYLEISLFTSLYVFKRVTQCGRHDWTAGGG